MSLRPAIESRRSRVITFLVGLALSNAGDMFAKVAVFWMSLELSGKAISIGALGGAWTLAMALSNLLSGPVVDRFRRRNVILFCNLALGCVSLAVYVLSTAGVLRIWHLWAFLIAEGIFGSPSARAFQALMPDLVGKDRLVRVNALMGSWGAADNLIEAAASGVVLGIWGPAPIFLFHAVMYFVGTVTSLVLPPSAGSQLERSERWTPITDLRVTLRYIVRERILRRDILLSLLANFALSPLGYMGPMIAVAVGAGSETYGFYQSLMIAGLLLGNLLASSIGSRWPKVVMWLGGTALYSVAFLMLGWNLNAWFAYGVWFIFGLGWTGARTYGSTLFQQILPAAHRGRILGTSGSASMIVQPLALAIAMLLVDRWAVGPVLVIFSVLMLVNVALRCFLLPLREKDWVLSDPEGASSSD